MSFKKNFFLKYCIPIFSLFILPLLSFGRGVATHEIAIVDTGFAVTVPTSWQMKKSRTDLTLTVKPSKGFSGGSIELFGVDFRGTADTWNNDQKLIAQSMNQSVDAQSQDIILGVPLLITQLTDPTNVKSGSIETGILMSASNQKLYFRLFTNSQSFTQLVSLWNSALTTLRTIDGSNPVADDPNLPLTKVQKEAKPTAIPTIINLNSRKKPKFFLGPVVIQTVYANRHVAIHLPLGWRVVKDQNGWTISNPALSYPLEMSLASNLDSSDPTTALLTLSGQSLKLFTKVNSRSEKAGKMNQAGAITDVIFRKGTSGKEAIESCEGFASVGEFYVLISRDFPRNLTKKEELMLNSLFDQVGIVKLGSTN